MSSDVFTIADATRQQSALLAAETLAGPTPRAHKRKSKT